MALTTCGLLFFEIWCTRLLGLTVGDAAIPLALGVALLGGCAAAALTQAFSDPRAGGRLPRLSLLAAASALSVLTVAALAAFLCARRSADADALLAMHRTSSWVALSLASRHRLDPLILGSAMALPHFFSGLVVIALFRRASREEFGTLYFLDLSGAAVGCIVCVVAMEYGGFSWPLALALGLPLTAACCLDGRRGAARLAFLGAAWSAAGWLAFSPSASAALEPRPNVRILAQPREGESALETWHAWNSYTRVAEVSLTDASTGFVRRIFAFGSGQGRVNLERYAPGAGPGAGDFGVALTWLAGAPKSLLVLFAGAGKEVVAADLASGGRTEITAVEINRQLVARALSRDDYGLKALYGRSNVRLRVSEARTFLDRDRSRYDAILLPFFGASDSSFFNGGGELSRYLFTREALAALLGRLAPGGLLVLYDYNKVLLLSSLRRIFEAQGRTDAPNCVIVMSLAPVRPESFFRPDGGVPPYLSRDWDTPLDNLALIVKPSGFTAPQIAAARFLARLGGQEVLYDPQTVDVRNPYRRVLRAAELSEELSRLQLVSRTRLSPVTDDRPYALAGLRAAERPSYPAGAFRVALIGLLLGLAGLGRARVGRGGGKVLGHLLYFAGIGCGFTFIEFGLMQKLGLLFGNSVYAMSGMLAALLFSCGLGSLWSRPKPGRPFPDWRAWKIAVLGSSLSAAALAALPGPAAASLLAWPYWLRMACVSALVLPLGLCLGQLFPRGLELAQSGKLPLTGWAWSVNAAACAGACAASLRLGQMFGHDALILLGAGFCLTAMIPLSVSGSSEPRGS